MGFTKGRYFLALPRAVPALAKDGGGAPRTPRQPKARQFCRGQDLVLGGGLFLMILYFSCMSFLISG